VPVDDVSRISGNKELHIRKQSDTISWVAIFLCVFCTIINIVLSIRSTSNSQAYTFPSATSFLSSKGMTREDIDNLRRPSQFIGFDKIHRNATTMTETKSFVNFPMLMADIDASRPHKAAKPRKGQRTPIGTVYPELSDMVATSSISTIVQFRALDYGMELCELSITIPLKDSSVYPLILPSSPIQVYTLGEKKPLYADSLSYENRPRRGNLIGEPHLKRNSTWKHTFQCLMDEIYTFEVACANVEIEQCLLRWTQDKEHGSFPAILMTQFSTI